MGEPEVDGVVFSGVSPNAGNWAIQAGVAEGIFEEYGLPTEMIFSATSPAALAALISNSVQFTSTLYDAGIQAHLQEPDVIYVRRVRPVPAGAFVPHEVKTVEDLRGTCGATNPPGTGDDLYTQMMIDGLSNGTMKSGTDYEIIQIGAAAPAIAAAFDAGQIQCRVTLPPVTGLLDSLGAYMSLAVRTISGVRELPVLRDQRHEELGSKSTRTPRMRSFVATWRRSPGSTTPPTSSGPSRSWPRTPASTPPPRNPPTSGS